MRESKKTRRRVCYRKDIERGFYSSTVEVFISLNLFIKPLSVLPYPANDDIDANDDISSLSS